MTMMAFSVDSETRKLKHAYAMRARVAVYFVLWTFAIVQGRTTEDADADGVEELESAEASTERQIDKNNKRLINIQSLELNCQYDDESAAEGVYRCSNFKFEEPEEIAFFELLTKVQIAVDGASYKLVDEQQQQISSLIFEKSKFINFPLHLFYELPQLSELDMRNCSIRYVNWESFLAANKLQILLLADNDIVELDERCFNYASELEFLFLSNNQLSSLHPDTFKGLSKLRHLDLSNNQLEQLPERLFEQLTALQQLTLAENRLRLISDKLLLNNVRLHTILLHSNKIRQLDEQAFRSSDQLLIVDLSHNSQLEVLVLNLNAAHLWARNCSLYRVNLFGAVANVDFSDNRLQELYFPQSEVLQLLKLRNNSLAHLVPLVNVPRLRELDLANNRQLRTLPDKWQTPQLELLDLSNTGLEQLPLAALRGSPHLRKLNVSSNNISDIDPRTFGQLTQLTHFFIHANNWNCFNLRLLMDNVILDKGITYTPDQFNVDFPGTYIHDIACMYRLYTAEREQSAQLLDASSASREHSQSSDPSEVEKLRQEFKAVVQHFEAKLDDVNAKLKNLNAKMQFLEHVNSSVFNQMTVMV